MPRPVAPPHLRQLFEEYLRLYANRDDRLTELFSEEFSGFTGGGDVLVKDRAEWVSITRMDFAQVREPIRIELKDVSIQALSDTVAVTTGFFTIHLPMEDHILSRETARLVLVFRLEAGGWKITHSGISIPYHGVKEGEVYPLQTLSERNRFLESLVTERTDQLSAANSELRKVNAELAQEVLRHEAAKAALQTSEERYRSILHASPDDITIADAEGRVRLVSPVAWAMFGCTCEEDFIGRPITDFIVPEDRERAARQLRRQLEGRVEAPREYRALRKDGSSFDIEVNSEFIRDSAGTPTGLVIIGRDISLRKRAEAERLALESQNRRLQKSQSLARMAGAIAHHFNNQLMGVMGNLELAIGTQGVPADMVDNLQAAMHSAREAAYVSRLMLTYLGQTPMENQSLDLAALCRQEWPSWCAASPKGTALSLDSPDAGPVIDGDATLLRQVLLHLLTNAWEASEHGAAKIVVRLTSVSRWSIPASRCYPVDWQPGDRTHACLEVSDSGGGIAEADFEKIFEPFYSSKFTGRGLGLPVVLGIVRAHDGGVQVESTVGQGSVFRLFLPTMDSASG